MKKLLLVCTLLALVAGGAFAQNWAMSYNKDNQINIDATLGYWTGFGINAGIEWVITEFKIGDVPIDFGVMGKATFQFASYGGVSGLYWGAGPLAALHLGLSGAPIEFFISAGLCIYGYSVDVPGVNGVGVHFASADGVIFHLSDVFGIIVESGFIGGFYWGAGVHIKL